MVLVVGCLGTNSQSEIGISSSPLVFLVQIGIMNGQFRGFGGV